MARWLIQLSGDDFDVDEFPHWFPHGELAHAFREDGKTYLTGARFDVLTDLSEINEAATQTVEEYFGIIRLLDSGIRKPSIGVIYREGDDGSRQGFQLAAGHASGRSKARFVSAGDQHQQTQAQELLAAARSNRSLQVAVALLALQSPTWPHLYRCLEEIEHFLGKHVSEANLCSANQRERFMRTANAAEVSGMDSRHRLGRFEPPANPMTLREARAFVDQLVHSTLRAVANASKP